jgi:hypothetical protein
MQFIPFVDALAIPNAVRLLHDGRSEQNARVGEKTQDRCGQYGCSKAAKRCSSSQHAKVFEHRLRSCLIAGSNSTPSSFEEKWSWPWHHLNDAGKNACLIVASLIIGFAWLHSLLPRTVRQWTVQSPSEHSELSEKVPDRVITFYFMHLTLASVGHEVATSRCDGYRPPRV